MDLRYDSERPACLTQLRTKGCCLVRCLGQIVSPCEGAIGAKVLRLPQAGVFGAEASQPQGFRALVHSLLIVLVVVGVQLIRVVILVVFLFGFLGVAVFVRHSTKVGRALISMYPNESHETRVLPRLFSKEPRFLQV